MCKSDATSVFLLAVSIAHITLTPRQSSALHIFTYASKDKITWRSQYKFYPNLILIQDRWFKVASIASSAEIKLVPGNIDRRLLEY